MIGEVEWLENGGFEADEGAFGGFDGKVISLYARGLTVREIRGHLHEIYGVDVSPDLISRVTDGEHGVMPGA